MFSRMHTLGHQQIRVGLHHWICVLANCANHQFRLGEASQSSDLRFFRIAHLDDVFGIHESKLEH